MPIAKESGGNFTPAPPGTHLARCFAVISLGTQHSEIYADAFKIMLMWELPHERVTYEGQERPMTISKEYTLSLSKKAKLRADLESWRGKGFTEEELKGFDVSKIIGQPCLLSVIHKTSGKGSTYAAIASVAKLTKGQECPSAFHKNVSYEVEHGKNKEFESLPEWVRKKIEVCEEWTNPAIDKEEAQVEEDPDSVPF